MVPRWRFLATFLRPVFSANRVQQVSDLHLTFALRPHHVRANKMMMMMMRCGSMADIQSAAAEIRRGKKEEEGRKKEQTTG